MKAITPIERLREFIAQARQNLERYATNPNASESAIAIKNCNLKELTDICNAMSSDDYTYACYWQRAELSLNAIVECRKDVGSLHIIIYVRQGGLPARLELNQP